MNPILTLTLSGAPTMRADTTTLDHLVINPEINPRTGTGDIAEIKAQIAVNGFKDRLLVREADGRFEVIDGSRRVAALTALVAEGKWIAHWPVDIDIVEADDAQAREMALAANVVRADLSPADEAVGFYRLKLSGESEDTIAARFAVPLRRVQQRLAIGALPDEILTALRRDDITLDCAQAFTLTPSAERQQAIFRELTDDPARGVTAAYVRDALVRAQVRGDSGMADFVGADAYEDAGGVVTRDLFSDTAWFEDGALLKRLFDTKLDATIRTLKDEGWGFVDVVKTRDWTLVKQEPGGKRVLSEEEKAELTRLTAERDKLDEALFALEESGSASWQEEEAARDKVDAIAARIAELQEKPYTAKQKAKCGVHVVVTGDCAVTIIKGLERPEKHTSPHAGEDAGQGAAGEGTTPQQPAETDWSEALRTTMATAAEHATKLAMAQVKPAIAARMGLAARILASVDRTYDAPFHSGHTGLKGGANFGPYARDLLAEFRDGDFAETVARLELKLPEQLVQIEACLAAADFECSSLANRDVRTVIEMIDPDMAAEGFTIGADFLGRLKREQLDAINADCGGKPLMKSARKADVVDVVSARVATTGWLPPELRTPSYEGPGSNAWAEKISAAAAEAATATPEAA